MFKPWILHLQAFLTKFAEVRQHSEWPWLASCECVINWMNSEPCTPVPLRFLCVCPRAMLKSWRLSLESCLNYTHMHAEFL